MSTGRLEAFSDGVFAIAITLLVLGVRVPHAEENQLARELWRAWPSLASYVLAFFVVGISWASHHAMFSYVVRVDRWLVLLNLGHLMCMAFVPFPTSLLAEYAHSSGNERVAAIAIGVTLTLAGVFFNAMWAYAARGHRHLTDKLSRTQAAAMGRRFLLGPILFGLTIPVAWISPVAVLVCFALLAIFYTFAPARWHSTAHS